MLLPVPFVSTADRYLFRQFLLWFVVIGFCAVHGVILPPMAQVMFLIVDRSLPWGILFLAYKGVAPNAAYLTLPFVAGITVVYVYHRAWQDRIIPVLFASGVSPWRLAAPAVGLAAMATVLGSVIAHSWAPAGAAQLENAKHAIEHGSDANALAAGRFNTVAPGGAVLFFERWDRTGAARQVFFHDPRGAQGQRSINAARARFREADEAIFAEFFDGAMIVYRDDIQDLQATYFEHLVVRIPVGPVPERSTHPSYQLSTAVLVDLPEEWSEDATLVRDARVELHKRIFIPLLALILGVFATGTALAYGDRAVYRIPATAVIGFAVMIANVAVVVIIDAGVRYWSGLAYLAYAAGLGMLVTGLWCLHRADTRSLKLRVAPRQIARLQAWIQSDAFQSGLAKIRYRLSASKPPSR